MIKMEERSLKQTIHEIIFEAETPSGKFFDIILMIAIILSVIIVLLDSVPSLNQTYGSFFFITEWILTILFTIEYALRIYTVNKSSKYIFSDFKLTKRANSSVLVSGVIMASEMPLK